MGVTTVSLIARETVKSIWNAFQPLHMKVPTENDFKNIAKKFTISGFRSHRSITDQIFTIKQIFETAMSKIYPCTLEEATAKVMMGGNVSDTLLVQSGLRQGDLF